MIKNIAIEMLLIYLKNARLSHLLLNLLFLFHIQKSYNIVFLS